MASRTLAARLLWATFNWEQRLRGAYFGSLTLLVRSGGSGVQAPSSSGHSSTLEENKMRTSKLCLVLSVIAVSGVTALGAGPAAASGAVCNPPTTDTTLHLDSGGGLNPTAPPPGIAAFTDSPALSRQGGNPFRLIGEWAGTVPSNGPCFVDFGNLHLWLGLKNSDDQGTNFDVRVAVLLNGSEVGSRDFICTKGLTRNPSLATEIS